MNDVYNELIELLHKNDSEEKLVPEIGIVERNSPLQLRVKSIRIEASELILVLPLGESVIEASAITFSPGERLFLLTSDYQKFYIIGRAAEID